MTTHIEQANALTDAEKVAIWAAAADLAATGFCDDFAACDASNAEVDPLSASATKWSLAGALIKAVYDLQGITLSISDPGMSPLQDASAAISDAADASALLTNVSTEGY
ncbi:MAG: hypothetical protein ABIW84_06730 [Ilumatobacteraceae bacterium]